MAAIEGYKRRAAAAGMAVDRIIVASESGGSGFWLSRWLQQRGGGGYGIQPPRVPLGPPLRPGQSHPTHAHMLLRTPPALPRGEARGWAPVPLPGRGPQ